MEVDAELGALAERLQARCLAAGLTVGTAESCTGGLVAHAITSVAGSSGYFRGAIVAYDDGIKSGLLGVPAEVLAAHGAVSAQTARSMATGARERLGVDLAASVTGIAGPGGATPGKPVGLTYLATASSAGVEVTRQTWAGERPANIRASAVAALQMLLAAADAVADPARGPAGGEPGVPTEPAPGSRP